MGEISLVVGPKGVGKTTVLSAFTADRTDVRHVYFGRKLAEIADMEGISIEGTTLDPDERTYLRRRTTTAIKQLAADIDPLVIVDTHLFFPTTYGFVPGLLADNVQTLDPERILVFTASAETIERRLRTDDARTVPYSSVEQIARHRELVATVAPCVATIVGSRIYFVGTQQRNPGATAERIGDIFDHDEELVG